MNRLSVFIIFILTSCSNLPLSDKPSHCSFPAHNPYPGGMINFTVNNIEIDEQIKLEKEELKYEICRNDDSSINLLIPIPLSFQKDQIKIIQSEEFIASVAIENKIYRESRIVIKNQDLVTPP